MSTSGAAEAAAPPQIPLNAEQLVQLFNCLPAMDAEQFQPDIDKIIDPILDPERATYRRRATTSVSSRGARRLS